MLYLGLTIRLAIWDRERKHPDCDLDFSYLAYIRATLDEKKLRKSTENTGIKPN
jgi:hypothetical protein